MISGGEFARRDMHRGVPARTTDAERLEADLAWALELDGPAVVILRGLFATAAPTP